MFGDMADADFNAKALEGVTDVVILAGLVGERITKRYPKASEMINGDGLKRLISQLGGLGLNKVIFVSTCSNYGRLANGEIADESFELTPTSPYTEAKIETEKSLFLLKGKVDYHATVLRFATAFGLSPRMRFDLLINEFVYEMYCGKEPLVYGAESWRPYCHVKDLALAVRRVLEAPVDQTSFEVFNVGGDANNFTKNGIIDEILGFLPRGGVQYRNHQEESRDYRVDFSKIRKSLCFEPAYRVNDGIRELVGALRNNLFRRVNENRTFYGNYEIEY